MRTAGIVGIALAALVALVALAAPIAAQAQPREQRVEDARRLFMEGLEAYQRGELHVAVQKLLASQRAVRHPETAFNIARCFERMGEAPRAIHWFRAYLRHGRPDERTRADIEHRMQLMQELQNRQLGQIYEAPPSTDALTAEARTFFVRGVAMYERREYDAAMQAFTQAHRFAPFPELLYNMALTSEKLEQLRDAIDYYREYLRLRPNAADRAQVEQHIAELREQRRNQR